jgi:hypothetical protein
MQLENDINRKEEGKCKERRRWNDPVPQDGPQ